MQLAMQPDGPRVALGVRQLDAYLGGGIPAGSAAMLLGPPFLGTENLSRQFLAEGVAREEPFVAILTDAAVFEWRTQLAALDPGYHAFEEAGLAHYIDMFSTSVDLLESEPYTEYVGAPMATTKTVAALAATLQRMPAASTRRLVFDSVSTLTGFIGAADGLMAHASAARLLKHAGVTGLFLVDGGAHSPAELQLLKRQVDGVIEMRHTTTRNELRVAGFGLPRPSPWVEHRVLNSRVEVVGSWHMSRV